MPVRTDKNVRALVSDSLVEDAMDVAALLVVVGEVARDPLSRTSVASPSGSSNAVCAVMGDRANWWANLTWCPN